MDPTEAKKAEAVRAFSEAVARIRRAAVEMAFIGEESER
jgi:hypothetical protein